MLRVVTLTLAEINPTVSAALIAAGIAIAGNITVVLVSRYSSRKSVEADLRRLQTEYDEADRQVRRDAYGDLMRALERLDALVSVYTVNLTMDMIEEWLHQYREANLTVRLIESPLVGDARRNVSKVLDALSAELERRQGVVPDKFAGTYTDFRDQMLSAGTAMANAMRDDLRFAPE